MEHISYPMHLILPGGFRQYEEALNFACQIDWPLFRPVLSQQTIGESKKAEKKKERTPKQQLHKARAPHWPECTYVLNLKVNGITGLECSQPTLNGMQIQKNDFVVRI